MADTTNQNTQDSSDKPKAKHYRYPIRQIKSNTDYLEIKVVKYEPPGLELKDNSLADISQGTKKVLDKIGRAHV